MYICYLCTLGLMYTYMCNYLPYLYVWHEFVYMSHTYTYTYVTYLHKHIWHTPNNICYLACMYMQAQKPSFIPRRKVGFLAWYTYACTAYIQIQRWHMYTSEIWCPFLLISYMSMYICYLHTLTYVTYINIHMWKIHIRMRMSYICIPESLWLHMAYVNVYMYICYLHAYMCLLPTYI